MDYVVHPEIDNIRKKREISRFFIFLFIVLGIITGTTFFVWHYSSTAKAYLSTHSSVPTETVKITTPRKEVIGFVPSWSLAENAEVNTDKMTQIIYFGLPVDGKGNIVKQNAEGQTLAEWSYLVSDQFAEIRKEAKHDNTKVLVAIKNFDNDEMSSLMSNKGATQHLSDQLIRIIRDYDLDGVNINFEYMTNETGSVMIYMNDFVTTLAKDLRTSYPEITISFDVYPLGVVEDETYDMVKIGEAVDQVILMGYDYHRVDALAAGPVAPLHEKENNLSIDDSIKSLLGRVDQHKIVLGIPFYGYEWQTTNRQYGSRTIQGTGAIATYKRVHNLIANRDDVNLYWNETTESPWLVYDQSGAIKQIYYEDKKSIGKKIDYVKENKLGGVAIWAVGYEGENQDLWEVMQKGLED